MAGRLVTLLTEGAHGGCRKDLGSDMALRTAPASENAWSGLFEGLSLVTGGATSCGWLWIAEGASDHI